MMIGILLALFYLIHGRKNCFGINDNVIVAECNSCNVVHDSQHFATKRAEADSPSNVSFSSVDVNGSSIAGKDDGPWIKPKPGITKPDNSKNKTKPDIRNKEVDDHPSLVPAKSIPVEINNEKPPKPRISNESYPIEIPGNGSIIKPTSNESFCFNPLNLDNVKTLRRCFCYDEICHANIDKKTSEITLNYPTGALAPLSKLSQFDCNWQTGFTSGTTIYLVDALNLPPMSNVTIGKILLPPISSRKIALVSPSSSPVSFSGSLRNSNFHAFAYHGFCTYNNGYIELPWNIDIYPSGSKLISSHFEKESKRNRPNAFCSWTFTAPKSERRLMSTIFYTSNLTSGNKLMVRSWNWDFNDTETHHFDEKHPPHLVSANRQLSVTFMSDLDKEGFEFSANVLTDRCSDELVPSLSNKGVIFDGSHRESMYGKGMRCKWLVSGHNTTSLKKIMLKVNYFNLIGFDYLMVYEVKPSTDEKILIGKYSGHSIPPYFETKNSFYLELATNYQDMYEMNGTDPHGHVDFTYDPEEDTDETNSKQNRTKKMNTNYYGVSINYTICDFECQNCKPGTYYNFEINACSLCPDDQISNQKGMLECVECPNATYAMDNTCVDCSKRFSLNLTKFNWVKHKCEKFGYGFLMLVCLSIMLGISAYFWWKRETKSTDSIDVMYESL